MAKEDPSIGITTEQVARISEHGMWDADGSVRPEAVRMAATLVDAVRARSAEGRVPDELGDVVERALNMVVPTFHRIPGANGVGLSAHMLQQITTRPCPLVVIPAGWTPVGWPLFEYAYLTLALKGYHVVAYTPRGIGWTTFPGTNKPWIGTSEGTVDVAGPLDREDGRKVLDFAIEALAPSRVAFFGESYGSGISQLVAAEDDRVDAVVALSTWGNLATSLYDNGTRHTRTVAALLDLTGGDRADKFDADTLEILTRFEEGGDMDPVVEWGEERSPENYVGGAGPVPTFFCNTWHEGLFPPNQMLRTFRKLTGPKHLSMWIGDHAVPEGPGLIAPSLTPNVALREAYAWLDHYLMDEDNGVDTWPEVTNQVMFTYVTTPAGDNGDHVIIEPARREQKRSWSAVTTDTETLILTGAHGSGDGALLPEATADTTGWRRSFSVGKEPEIVAMDAILSTGQREWEGNPKAYRVDEIDRGHALVWSTEPFASSRRIRGIPRVRLGIDSTESAATVIVYLLDVDADGVGRMITHEPMTVSSGLPATPVWEMQAAAYDMSPGHRLVVVVDSMDPHYSTDNILDATITVGSFDGAACFVEIPLG
ncbi:alpha/beta fold hydrolase [Nocardia aurea]|uniref:alpha/beta fold hydrolase n=1 Tax=Nocardia aurea TaxID=2144174 RepID=UPI0033A17794